MLYNRQVKLLDFKKYKRFFAFGCSFTNYKWPTWADIISQEIPEYYNYGISGAGNYYIFNSVTNADQIFNFNSDDLVMVKWTNVHREDRFIEDSVSPNNGEVWINRWLTPGNIYSQGIYNKNFMNHYWSDTHGLMRDLSLITALQGYLTTKKLDFDFLTMVPLSAALDGARPELNQTAKNALNFYKPVLSTMPPSIYELIFNHSWHSISPRAAYYAPWDPDYVDNHAHPKEHLDYIQRIYPDTVFKQETIDYANHWHKVVLEKHTAYDRPLIDRPMVKNFHSWRENLDHENNTM